jgi:urease accessory protein
MLLFTRLLDALPDTTQRAAALRLPLDHDTRVKSRFAIVLPDAGAVAANLPRGTVLRDGAVLASADGRLGLVVAAPQALARVHCTDQLGLLRAAYHLANRHVPVQLAPDHLLLERDPVLERMLVALGASVEHVEAPFEPESGAYDAHRHNHGHHHHHDEVDTVSATLGEQLSIEAHRARPAVK